VLLLWALDRKYLWQDEANTAVLAARMLRFGRPLAYDGVNFVGLDHSPLEGREPVDRRTGSARAVVDYYVRQGFLKPDSSWKWHPWGQFVVAAVSLRLFGQTTLAARLPFALVGVATVLLLYRLARDCCMNPLIAQGAALLLTLNAYWILHDRQCRYYALSSLFLVLTLWSYMRWQRDAGWGMPLFVASAWGWFQVDYGTVWPVLLILFAESRAIHWRKPWRSDVASLILAALMAPFVWYYELWGRLGLQQGTWTDRFRLNLFNTNEYVLPTIVLAGAIVLLARRRRALPPFERRIVVLSCGIMLALYLWVPTMTTAAFLRYVIMAAPVGCLVAAWFIATAIPARFAWPAFALLAITPWASVALRPLIATPDWYETGWLCRPELLRLRAEVFGNPGDVNRDVVGWLGKHAKPSDEILVNYEDMPLMYYLPNPIRGGVAAFRVRDDAHSLPRFLVFRPDINFVSTDVFQREAIRFHWKLEPVTIPSATWGNNPDPISESQPEGNPPVLIIRRLDD
jgi:hypothetical protein